MGPSRLLTIALSSITLTSAFRDTSPVFLFSTSQHLDTTSLPRLASSSQVSASLESALASCDARTYVVVSQPGVQTIDYARSASAPHLQRYLSKTDAAIRSTAVVPEMRGSLDADALTAYLVRTCGAAMTDVDPADRYIALKDEVPRVVRVRFGNPLQQLEERRARLVENDSFLNTVISSLHDANYTVILATSAPQPDEISELEQSQQQERESSVQWEAKQYEMDEGLEPMHIDLKRDVEIHVARDNRTASLPLFETYQFLTPAIFMGFLTMLPFVLLVYVGISAVAGLEVSYFAFSKEMGPTQQKKQQ